MKESLQIVVGSLDRCAQALGISSAEVLEQVSELSQQCVATAEGSGLTSAYSSAFLLEQLSLPQSRLALCLQSNRLVGFALYHLGSQHFPSNVQELAEIFAEHGRLGYAQVIAVHPDYRGPDFAIYDRMIKNCSLECAGIIDGFVALVRRGNSAARLAHVRRGWILTPHSMKLAVAGTVHEFDCLLLLLDKSS